MQKSPAVHTNNSESRALESKMSWMDANRTWTPKVCRIMAFWATFRGLGPLFYLLWGFRKVLYRPDLSLCYQYVVVRMFAEFPPQGHCCNEPMNFALSRQRALPVAWESVKPLPSNSCWGLTTRATAGTKLPSRMVYYSSGSTKAMRC